MRFSRWDQVVSTGDTDVILTKLALWHASQITATATRLYFTILLLNSDSRSICSYSPEYRELSIGDAIHVRQITAFFTKRADIDLGYDRRAEAFSGFLASECLCAETNTILKLWSQGDFKFPPDVESVFFRASQKISKLLGDVPSLGALKPHFGPGATTQIIKKNASARLKLSQTFACSEELIPAVKDCLEELPGWIPFGVEDSVQVPVVIHDGRLSFVQKNAKTDRAIVVEPMLNSMFQLAIGDDIARKLLTVGIDIKDQSRNQRMAREGSLTGDLATLDLSSASDTIARELVYHLLPLDWALFLDQFRSGTVTYEGETLKLQKFSSMGNGFTFPLETLIFWALASSCTEARDQKKVSVYGDDIIIPTYGVPLLQRVLTSAGFILNTDKSFSSGPFRESCGKDYLSGIDIRPCYIKDVLSGESMFTLHNFYARRYDSLPASILLQYLDESLVIWGPDGYGDGHLIGDWTKRPHNRFSPDKLKPSGWAGYIFDTYTHKGRKSYRPTPGDYVYPCYSIYASYQWSVHDGGDVSHLADPLGYRDACTPSTSHDKKTGVFGVVLPGTKGYKRISIYTLTPI